jgi:ABC-type hemin transport system substrate-binding protein
MNKPTRFFLLAQLLMAATVVQAKPTSVIVSNEDHASPIDRVAQLRADIVKVQQMEVNTVAAPETSKIAQWPNWGNWGNYWNNWRNY